jgi:hypothetical protein
MSLGGYAISSGTIACCSFEKTAWQLVPKLLQWRYRTQRILSEAQSAIVELGLDTGTMHKQSCILPRIKTLKSKFDNLKVELSCVQGI